MKVLTTAIEGVVILEPEVFGDARGYFFESYSQRRFDAQVRPVRFVQDNESHSRYGVLRGLHFQKGRYSQSKLVRVVRGRVLDVAVDIRRGSPTFGRHVAVELTEDNKRQFFIPRGFAHGFAVLSDEATFQYKCDNPYAPESEGAIAWNDPSLGIDWRLAPEDVVLSPKDSRHPLLSEAGCWMRPGGVRSSLRILTCLPICASTLECTAGRSIALPCGAPRIWKVPCGSALAQRPCFYPRRMAASILMSPSASVTSSMAGSAALAAR